jgi:hypothetical protein
MKKKKSRPPVTIVRRRVKAGRGARAGWSTVGMLMLGVRRKDGRTLGIVLASVDSHLDTWQPLLVDTAGHSFDEIFDDHAHKTFPPVVGLLKAIAFAESVARKWQRAAKSEPACPCDEIPMKAPREAAAE